MKQLTKPAKREEIPSVIAFVDEELEQAHCPWKDRMQISIAIDELYGNIASYAYSDEDGQVTVTVEADTDSRSVCISFIDEGKPFDPLSREDPDTTVSARKRQIGGLGIFMVKKSMDELHYEYENGKNILTIRKIWSTNE